MHYFPNNMFCVSSSSRCVSSGTGRWGGEWPRSSGVSDMKYSKSSMKYSSVEKRICNLTVCHVDHKKFWKSGSFQEETGLISFQRCLQMWWALGTCVCGAPRDLTWAPRLGGCVGAGGLTRLPWSQERQFILKTPNGTPVTNTCVSRHLLLVPPKRQFLKFGMTQKRGWWYLFWGDFLKDFFFNRKLNSRTEWNWTEFLDKETRCHKILFSGCPLFQLTRHTNLIRDHYFNFKKFFLNLVPASLRCRGIFANKLLLFLLFNWRKAGWLGPFRTRVFSSSSKIFSLWLNGTKPGKKSNRLISYRHNKLGPIAVLI